MIRLLVVLNGFFALLVCAGVSLAGEQPLFETDVQPILTAKCGKCHNAEAKKGGLDFVFLRGSDAAANRANPRWPKPGMTACSGS